MKPNLPEGVGFLSRAQKLAVLEAAAKEHDEQVFACAAVLTLELLLDIRNELERLRVRLDKI